MSTDKSVELIDEAIRLEENMAKAYSSFREIFTKGTDAGFWWKLAMEEQSHATLLQTEKQYGIPGGLFPVEVLGTTLESLQQVNKSVEYQLAQNQTLPPTRRDAFAFALQLETSAGECHFQAALEKEPTNRALKLFQKLAKHDRDHAKRLRKYMASQGLA